MSESDLRMLIGSLFRVARILRQPVVDLPWPRNKRLKMAKHFEHYAKQLCGVSL